MIKRSSNSQFKKVVPKSHHNEVFSLKRRHSISSATNSRLFKELRRELGLANKPSVHNHHRAYPKEISFNSAT